jgi:carboxypeptidase Q
MSPATPSAQVGERPDLAAIALLRGASAEQSQVMVTAGYLTDVYGPRLTGSPQLKSAAAYVVDRLTAWGILTRYERWGPFGPGWTNDRFIALALAPQSYPLTAYTKAWTPGTPGEVIADAVLAPIKTNADFVRYRGTLHGKFVLTALPDDVRLESAMSVRKYSPADLKQLTSPAAPGSRGSSDVADLTFARKRMEFFIEEHVAALIEPSHGTHGTVFVSDGRLVDDAALGGP